MLDILFDQFEHVGDDQHPQSRITLRNVADQVSDDHAFAGRGRHRHERIAAAARPIVIQRGERFSLVWTKLEHDLASGRCFAGEAPANSFHQRCACHGAGRRGLLPFRRSRCRGSLVAEAAGLAGCPVPPALFPAAGCGETLFLSG